MLIDSPADIDPDKLKTLQTDRGYPRVRPHLKFSYGRNPDTDGAWR